MTRKERKEAARIRCEERVNGYKLSVKKYVVQMSPTLEKGIRHIEDCAKNEIRLNVQMKDEIERCQGETVSWFVSEYGDILESDTILNSNQIENWRTVLYNMGVGPYAYIMPASEIQAFKDLVQSRVNQG